MYSIQTMTQGLQVGLTALAKLSKDNKDTLPYSIKLEDILLALDATPSSISYIVDQVSLDIDAHLESNGSGTHYITDTIGICNGSFTLARPANGEDTLSVILLNLFDKPYVAWAVNYILDQAIKQSRLIEICDKHAVVTTRQAIHIKGA